MTPEAAPSADNRIKFARLGPSPLENRSRTSRAATTPRCRAPPTSCSRTPSGLPGDEEPRARDPPLHNRREDRVRAHVFPGCSPTRSASSSSSGSPRCSSKTTARSPPVDPVAPSSAPPPPSATFCDLLEALGILCGNHVRLRGTGSQASFEQRTEAANLLQKQSFELLELNPNRVETEEDRPHAGAVANLGVDCQLPVAVLGGGCRPLSCDPAPEQLQRLFGLRARLDRVDV
jgi:hypothetical protein